MENSKLIDRLRSFSEEEYADFILFAESPYFNKNRVIIRLLTYLKKYHPILKGTKIKKEYVFKKVYSSEEEFKEKRLANLLSATFQLSEDFVGFDRFKKSPLERVQQELLAHRDNQRNDDFRKAFKKIEEQAENMLKDEGYHLALYQLNKEIYLHPVTPRNTSEMPSLKNLLKNLDDFYLKEKMYFSILARNRMRVTGEHYEILLLNLELKIKNEEKELQFLTDLEKLLFTNDVNSLSYLSQNFIELTQEIPLKKRKNLFGVLFNVTSQLNRDLNNSLDKLHFGLLKIGLKSKFFFNQDGNLQEDFYFNICSCACNVNEFDWANEFVETYSTKLIQAEHVDIALKLGQAIVLFEKAQQEPKFFDAALDFLLSIDIPTQTYNHRVKSMILRLFFLKYKAGEEDIYLVLYFANSFEKQIKRNKNMHNTLKESIINFIKIVRLLAKSTQEGSEKSEIKVVREYKKIKHLYGRKWIEKRIEEIPKHLPDNA